MYPISRLRRLRMTPNLRALVRETALEPADFIAPLFVVHGILTLGSTANTIISSEEAVIC